MTSLRPTTPPGSGRTGPCMSRRYPIDRRRPPSGRCRGSCSGPALKLRWGHARRRTWRRWRGTLRCSSGSGPIFDPTPRWHGPAAPPSRNSCATRRALSRRLAPRAEGQGGSGRQEGARGRRRSRGRARAAVDVPHGGRPESRGAGGRRRHARHAGGSPGRDRLVRDGAGFVTRHGGERYARADLLDLLDREPARFSGNVLSPPGHRAICTADGRLCGGTRRAAVSRTGGGGLRAPRRRGTAADAALVRSAGGTAGRSDSGEVRRLPAGVARPGCTARGPGGPGAFAAGDHGGARCPSDQHRHPVRRA